MAIEKTSVFISSRFSEFDLLRKALAERLNGFPYAPIHAVELDDNGAETMPPSVVCLNWIKHSELLILLLGDSYGPPVQGESISCTHLEYRAAMAEDSETRVLPFFIGEAMHRNWVPIEGSDSTLDRFRREVMQNHRVGKYRRPSDDAGWTQLLEIIIGWITNTIWEVRFRDLNQESDADVPDSGEIAGVSDVEISKLESLRREGASDLALLLQTPTIESPLDAARKPRALAAAEQLAEARLALQIGERAFAERHLREAVSLRPLDPVANEWLARVLLSKGRKKQVQEAMKLAECAARIYGKSDQALRAAAASILAARAAGQFDRERGIEFARDAIDFAGWFGQAHLELARQLAQSDLADEALGSLRRTFDCYPAGLDNVRSDPAFESMQSRLDAFLRNLLGEIRSIAGKARDAEAKLVAELGNESTIDPTWALDGKLSRLVYGCRRSVLRQLKFLQAQASQCLYADAINTNTGEELPIYVLDAASLTFSGSRQIEVTSIFVREGQVVPVGAPILKYTGMESGRHQSWSAPVPMKILRVSQKPGGRPIRGVEHILMWTPAPQVVPRYELTPQLNSALDARDKLVGHQTDLSSRATAAKIAQRILAGFGGVLLLAPAIVHEGLLAGLLSFAAGGACAWYSFKKWQELRGLNNALERCAQELNATHQSIDQMNTELKFMENRSCDLRRRLMSAAAYWQDEAVSLITATMPFPGLRGAQKGDWVVVAPKTVLSYGRSVGLEVILPADSRPAASDGLAVYRVTERDSATIVLSSEAVLFPIRTDPA